MSRLSIFDERRPAAPLFVTEDGVVMGAKLGEIGVRFERWESPVMLDEDASSEAILAAFKPYLDELMGATGAGSADVIKLTPTHPQAAALRAKFLDEHRHTEDEIRFFVEGSGHFVMHVEGRVYDALCTKGDLISVPANTRHWFDAGPAPLFTALRVFSDQSGWVAHFTGDPISAQFDLT
ncbi:MAG: acireductone dioxygenase [Rhodospirillales bacterium 20-60-12]|nr:MAG: acireductone dioxygenase [Rhodospirillales bacterium 20-60-12]HQT67462.1 cupin domain-containing protein [Acetobacteraceae bacterium]HQU01447.1 cupin domain-containing protein [Acetobacteraceae bacterium]